MTTRTAATTEGPLTLYLDDFTRVAGETIQGRVDIDFRLAQESNLQHLRIKFRGEIFTKITVQTGQTTSVYRQTIPLFHEKYGLWDLGAAYPAPDSHILSCPFQFTLPHGLPPSFHCSASARVATVSYGIEVVGERSGLFRFNHRIRRSLSVVPAAMQDQLRMTEALRQGWPGAWKTYALDEKLRRGIWGDYAHARVKLTMPDLSAFPISTPIPLSLIVETDTKPMDREDAADAPVDKHGKPLFPAPPEHSAEVTLKLQRWVQLRARRQRRTVNNDFKLFGGLGDPARVAAVRHEPSPPEWVPAPGKKDDKGRGFWRRTIRFETAVAFPYAPTCRTETLEWEYKLQLSIPFPGIGNDLKLMFPIRLDPAAACPPRMDAPGSSSGLTYADVLPAGPPPMADLPPEYWAGEHVWDGDEKN